ncbi:MAG: Rieske 2Fe-2S domain-containing protein [Deltaproteobacteria bacterium]|nr:MAG: Rieske 2Fe-2S domain-containing protein [Deltaproteobacteria bacterium]
MSTMPLKDDATVVQRIFDHIDHRTTDVSDETWREPVANYTSPERFAAERELVLRRYPTPFCPSAALPEVGSYVARDAAGTPILAVRGADGRVRAFRNACRHRGTQLAAGTGCERAFVCRYHGWTYALDGALRHVPHEYGFPGLDKSTRGLVPVAAVAEVGGMVFVTQDAPSPPNTDLDRLPPMISSQHRLLNSAALEVPVNWKIFAEGFLEGYHIRSTHTETFYPRQFDNLNVIETFGRNRRIAFPYRAVNKLRSVTPAEWSVDGKLTYVYHLFPNVMIATFPANIFMTVLEPVAVDRTVFITYVLTTRSADDVEAQTTIKRGGDFVQAGAVEDREIVCAIQRGVASGANEFFEFGRFEGLLTHFHRELRAALDFGKAHPRTQPDGTAVR